jgi:hypothetical protein
LELGGAYDGELAYLLSSLFQQMGVAGPGSVRAIADVHANQCIWPLEANARKPLFALRLDSTHL